MTHKNWLVANALHVGWISLLDGSIDGSLDRPCAALLRRVQAQCDASNQELVIVHRHLSSTTEPLAMDDQLQSMDRIVIASETRLAHPWSMIDQLQRTELACPWGVVTGHWHAGSRRTGIGPATFWQQPWYRWWEAWYGWFFPALARPAALVTNQFAPVTTPLDLAMPATRLSPAEHSSHLDSLAPRGHLLILCACPQAAQGWQLMAEHVHWQSTVRRELSADEAFKYDAVLWDDSLVPCLPQREEMVQAVAQCQHIHRLASHAKLIVALNLGHLDIWPALSAVGASDFLIKPSPGLPLCDYLHAWPTNGFVKPASLDIAAEPM